MFEGNPDHLEVLRQGVRAWNAWRESSSAERPLLAGANLEGANLEHVDLTEAILTGARLSGANLRGASLRRAVLMEADFSRAVLQSADCRESNLRGANLERALLGRALFVGANLQAAGLRGAELLWADLTGADLRHAVLDEAYLFEAKLRFAKLEGASLVKTDLRDTVLDRVALDGLDLSSVVLRWIDPADVEFVDGETPRESAPPSSIVRGTRCASKTDFVRVLQRWYDGTDEPTIGGVGSYGGKAWLWVRVGGYECHLNADTKRDAVFQFLEWARFRGSEYPWHVRANRKGVCNKVVVHPQGIETPGFYLYVKPALPAETTL